MIPKIPTNGTLMNPEDLPKLEVHVQLHGSDLEKALMAQVNAMIASMVSVNNMRKVEFELRLCTESQARELARKIRTARLALSTPMSKLKIADLKHMIEMARQELDELGGTEETG